MTSKRLLALKAVCYGCNVNKKLFGSTYCINFGTKDEQEISYYDAITEVLLMIDEEERCINKQ